jgi:polyhydroxybutyrate depolymerase
LIDQLEKQYNIDSKRIYANGLSNGGGMSFYLACQLSDRITAIGSVAGAFLFVDCQPNRPVPALIFHGTGDRVVPYRGRATPLVNSFFPDIATFASQWAEWNGCDPTPVGLPVQGDVSGVHYANRHGKAEVDFYTINGGGHGWPGGKPIPKILAIRTTQDIDATRVMWDFFSKYALDA